VNAQAFRALEFELVLERLADAAATPYGSERARGLVPATAADEVERRQSLTSEAVALLDHAAEPPLQGIPDIDAAVEFAGRGGALAPRALLDVAAAVEGALRARSTLAGQDLAPALAEIGASISPALGALAEEIRRCVDEETASVRDTASPRLRQLRRELRDGRRRVEETLQRLVRSPQLRSHLQETFIAERAGRPVLAVRAGSRSSVAGIVHDASGSGQTLFVEPFEVVELSNRQSETAAEEREEVERVLASLSAAIAGEIAALHALVDAVGALDLAVAAGTLSRRWRGSVVLIGEAVRLTQARHPLLDPERAVPIDLELDAMRALVISGPNTGGKTVALKTLGLAVLLHQSGLRVPALEVELPVFDEVLVEIGDQQSIAMSLSSFSAHVRNLIAILKQSTPRSLVLIDEPASGTDPVEGAALAQALLERLAQQARLTVATTHYAELKEWASAADGVANAATAIDPETHEPLYRLSLGRAGTSHALQTAERLGLDRAVVARARRAIDPARRLISTLLEEAEAAERAAVEERDAVRAERAAAEAATRRAAERELVLAEEIERVRGAAAAAREQEVARTRDELGEAKRELAALREEIRAARRLQRDADRAAPEAARARDRRLGRASERAERAEAELQRLDEPLATVAALAVGDPVEAPSLGLRGTITGIHGEQAEVAGNAGQRVRIALARLRPSAAQASAPLPAVSIRTTVPTDLRDTVDVRGRSAQEAREAVRELVDDAAVAGLPNVHVVHGRGTGVLKRAVRDELERHPLVHAIAAESADGATVAHLTEG